MKKENLLKWENMSEEKRERARFLWWREQALAKEVEGFALVAKLDSTSRAGEFLIEARLKLSEYRRELKKITSRRSPYKNKEEK